MLAIVTWAVVSLESAGPARPGGASDPALAGGGLPDSFTVQAFSFEFTEPALMRDEHWAVLTGHAAEHARPSVEPLGLALVPGSGSSDEEARLTLRPTTCEFSFDRALVSWSIATPRGAGYRVELRVRADEAEDWSPWLVVGDAGAVPGGERVVRFAAGASSDDLFESDRGWTGFQVRVRAFRAAWSAPGALLVERLTVVGADRAQADEAASRSEQSPDASTWDQGTCGFALPRAAFPAFRLPATDTARLEHALGDTMLERALAILLAVRGLEPEHLRAWSEHTDLDRAIGTSRTRALQAAFDLGRRGALTRFVEWRTFAKGTVLATPRIAWIDVEHGALPGAPYRSIRQHPVVLLGFDERGNVLLHDPAARDAGTVPFTCDREAFAACWLAAGAIALTLD